jgi:KipI family sensor histidine kinase inhibitor
LIGDRPFAHPLGDSAITISFGVERSAELLQRVRSAAQAVAASKIPAVEDVVPAYLALTVFYDPLQVGYDELAARLLAECARASAAKGYVDSRQHLIDVVYDGIDLDAVAVATGLSGDEIVERHTARTYTVDILGFVPGFAYLSDLDPGLQLPRRPQPRPRVAAGSVAIAAEYTGIYPLDTPGGWHIIGHTSAVMFDALRDPPALLAPGDSVRFTPIA